MTTTYPVLPSAEAERPYFDAIPWCAKLLSAPGVVVFTPPSRLVKRSSEHLHDQLFGRTLNTPETIPACVAFFEEPASEQGPGSETKKERDSHSATSRESLQTPSAKNGVGIGERPQLTTPMEPPVPVAFLEPVPITGDASDSSNRPWATSQALHQGTSQTSASPALVRELSLLLALQSRALDGFPGVAHGGLLAVLLDEVMGRLIELNMRRGGGGEAAFRAPVATRTLDIQFRRKVSTPCVVRARAWLVGVKDSSVPGDSDGRSLRDRTQRMVLLGAEILDADGRVLVGGKAVWVNLDASKL